MLLLTTSVRFAQDCTYEAVATVAGLPGGSDELIMLDKLAEDAAEVLIRQNIGMVMSLAHKYAASSSGGVGYEDLIPFGIEVRSNPIPLSPSNP
jgi:hypothetical protein